MFSDGEKSGGTRKPTNDPPTSSIDTTASSPSSSPRATAAEAKTIHRYVMVPWSCGGDDGEGVSALERVSREPGVPDDLGRAVRHRQRLFSFFSAAECNTAPESLAIELPEDLFALKALDDAIVGEGEEEQMEDEAGTDGLKDSPRERVAVLAGSGTSGTVSSLQWARRKLQERTNFRAGPGAAMHLHATPIGEYKELACLLVTLSDAPASSATASTATTAIMEGPLLGLYCDRLGPADSSTATHKISSAWEHAAVKVKKSDWKNMDAIIRDEGQDRGRLTMEVADGEETATMPAIKRTKVESKGSAAKAASSASSTSRAMTGGRTTAIPKRASAAAAAATVAMPVSAKANSAGTAVITTGNAPPPPAAATATATGSTETTQATASSTHAQFAEVAEAVLAELQNEGKRALPFKEWQKLVLKRLPEYRTVSSHMKSKETRHIATDWFDAMKTRLQSWLTVEKKFLIDPHGNVVGY